MLYRLLADAVLVAHAAFIAFVMLGGLLALPWPRVAWLHLPAVAWGAGIALIGGICPLTPLENRWRNLAGEQGYTGGYVEHYLVGLIYPEGLTRAVQVEVGLLVLAVNAAVYLHAWRRWRARRRD
jgi:hypothetical protein